MADSMSIDTLVEDTKKQMQDALDAFENDLKTIRTGKASPSLVEGIQIDYYGSTMRIKEIANITAPEPRLVVIQPWDKNAVSSIEKAILGSNLGITPSSDGNVIRLPIPELSEERRTELTKYVKERAEEARVEIRNVRRTAKDIAKKAEKSSEITEDDLKDLENKIQKLTDESIEEVDQRLETKNEELMTV